MVEGGSMVPGDGAQEKLEHQSRFLRERGLASPEMEECNGRLSLFVRLAGGNSTKLDPQFLDQLHAELADAALKQLRVTGLFEQWLDAWDVHNGIKIEPSDEHSTEVTDVTAGRTTTVDRTRDQRVDTLAADLRETLRALSGEPAAEIPGAATERQ